MEGKPAAEPDNCINGGDFSRHGEENLPLPQYNQSAALLDARTQVIALCDHYEYMSDNNSEVGGDNNGDETKKPMDIEIPEDETAGGYASGPEHLEHSSEMPMLQTNQPQQSMIAGKKRRRQNKKKADEESCMDESGQGSSQRKKKIVTNCEHSERDFYAKGMCKNCYHKQGRTKLASCCPDKKLYAKKLCQNCYMKHYGKEKRKENRNAKAAARQMIEPFPAERQSSEKNSSKKSISKRQSMQPMVRRRNSMQSDPTAPTVTKGGMTTSGQMEPPKITKQFSNEDPKPGAGCIKI